MTMHCLKEHLTQNLPQKYLNKEEYVDDPRKLADYIKDNCRPGDRKFVE